MFQQHVTSDGPQALEKDSDSTPIIRKVMQMKSRKQMVPFKTSTDSSLRCKFCQSEKNSGGVSKDTPKNKNSLTKYSAKKMWIQIALTQKKVHTFDRSTGMGAGASPEVFPT